MSNRFYRQIRSQPGTQLNRLVPVMGSDGSGGGGGGDGGNVSPEVFVINGMSWSYSIGEASAVEIDGNLVVPHDTSTSSAFPVSQMTAAAPYFIEIDVARGANAIGGGPIIRGGYYNNDADYKFSDGASFSLGEDMNSASIWVDKEVEDQHEPCLVPFAEDQSVRACFLIKGTMLKVGVNGKWFDPQTGGASSDPNTVQYVDIGSFDYLVQPAGLFFVIYQTGHRFMSAPDQLYRPAGAIACEFTNFVGQPPPA